MSYYLTLLECGSIQSYIFASNRLREAVGGSYIVKQATEQWLSRHLQEWLSTRFNKDLTARVEVDNWKTTQPSQILEPNGQELQAELLFSGGGNAAILFRDKDRAKDFVSYYSSLLIKEAPALVLLAAVCEVSAGLKLALETAEKELYELKEQGWNGFVRPGLSITRSCATTGQPAAGQRRHPEPEWLSAGSIRRYKEASHSEANLKEAFAKLLEDKYQFPLDLDELGGREGENHLAVVHIDGNRIGEQLRQVRQSASDDQNLVVELRNFSKLIREVSQEALEATLEDLVRALPALEKKGLQLAKVRDKKTGKPTGKHYFPLRPLIYGGDDLTFVCEGRIGLTLAACYLSHFNQLKNGRFSACAGIAIARTHFPLTRAYQLSEKLCSNAKKASRQSGEEKSSWLDFQILLGGLTGTLEQLRHDTSKLYRRPWRVEPSTRKDEQSWSRFREAIAIFQNSERWSRSQVKDLRVALAAGPDATGRFLEQSTLRGRELPEWPGIQKNGWSGSKTPFYDPIEALDFYLTL
ncbi:MAG: hypothetical protein HXX20_07810 [Chloroflexi bacterium]|nr:hypothetical protein [Chloroflexota bacterium]